MTKETAIALIFSVQFYGQHFCVVGDMRIATARLHSHDVKAEIACSVPEVPDHTSNATIRVHFDQSFVDACPLYHSRDD